MWQERVKIDRGQISKSRSQEPRKLCGIDFYLSRDGWVTMGPNFWFFKLTPLIVADGRVTNWEVRR